MTSVHHKIKVLFIYIYLLNVVHVCALSKNDIKLKILVG